MCLGETKVDLHPDTTMTARPVTGGRLLRNTIANGAGSIVVAMLAVLLTPLFLDRLGTAEYGIWLLALTLTFGSGYLGLADLGLQQAGVRKVAAALSVEDAGQVNRVVSSMMVLFVVMGAALGTLLALAAGGLSSIFDVPTHLSQTARTVFALVGVQIALDLPGASLLAVLEGAQRYALLRLIEVGTRLLWAVLAVLAVLRGHGVVAMAVLSLATGAAGLAASFVAAHHVEPRLRIRLALASWSTLRSIIGQGGSLLTLRVLSIVYRQMDRAIIGIAVGAAAVSRYEVAYKIHATAAIALSIAPSAVLPAAAHLGSLADGDQLRSLYVRGTKYAVALCVPIAVAALLYARALIVTWVGPAYEPLTGVTRLFLLYPILVSAHVIGVTMLVGVARMREIVRLAAVSVLVNLGVSVALTSRYGVRGVVIGTLVGYAIVWVPYLRLMLSAFDLSARRWAGSVLLPNVAPLAAQLLLGLATVARADRSKQLWQVGLLAMASCALSWFVFMTVILGRQERRSLLNSLRRPTPNPGPTLVDPIP